MSDHKPKIILDDVNKDRLIEIEAERAVSELQRRTSIVNPTMIKGAIEKRLRAYLGPGVALPDVRVERTFTPEGRPLGFDIQIKPGGMPQGIEVRRVK